MVACGCGSDRFVVGQIDLCVRIDDLLDRYV